MRDIEITLVYSSEPPRDTEQACLDCGELTMTWATDCIPLCDSCMERTVAETMADLAAQDWTFLEPKS